MEAAKQNSKSFQGMDLSSLEVLRGSNLQFSSTIARTKEWQVKKGLNITSSGVRLGADGSSGLYGDFFSPDMTPSVGSATCVQEGNMDPLSITKRRRDDMSPLTATVASSSPSFAAPTPVVVDEGSGTSNPVSSVGSRSRHRKTPSDFSSQLREALEICSKVGDESIHDELVASFVDKKAISEFLQQRKGGVCVSLECTEGEVDEQSNDGDRKAFVLAATNSSSLSNGTGTMPMSKPSGRELTTLLSAMLKFGPSDVDGIEKDDNASLAVQLPGTIVETVSNAEHHLDVIGLLQYLGIRDEQTVEELSGGKRIYSEESDYEDLDDIQKIIDKINPLSLQTMKELARWWGIQLEDQGSNEFYLMSIAEHFRLIAVTILAVVTDRLGSHLLSLLSSGGGQCQQCNNINGNAGGIKKVCSNVGNNDSGTGATQVIEQREDDQDERVRGLLFSLRQGVRMLSADHVRCLASMFGFVDCCRAPEDIFMTISALGVLAFFSPLPVQLLENVCQELSISTSDEGTEPADVHHLPALLAEKVSHYFYPLRHPVPSMAKLPFMPQMRIHEHAPGRYTCTVDNANFMKVLTLHRLVSNRFSCNKISWYALLTVFRDNVSFYVWHRHSASLVAKMVIRTQDPRKKRKNNRSGGGNNDSSPSSETALRESSALFLERETEIAPGEFIGFENFVTLPIALGSFTMSQSGYRLYSCAEDRLVFQCALDLTNPDGTPFVKEGRKKTASNQPNGKSTSIKHESSSSTGACAGGQQTPVELTAATTAEDEKRFKDWGKAINRLEKSEALDRDAVEQAWGQGHRQLMNEHSKSYQKAVQKAKDRERKMLLAKVGPSPELQRELDTLTQTVVANRAQVAKLTKAKAKEEAAIKRLREQIEEGNKELERLRQQLKSGGEVLAGLEAETATTVARAKEREEAKRHKQQELAAALHISELSATRHETLAINDLQSFWAPSFTNSAALQTFASTTSSKHISPRCSPQSVAAAEPSVSSVAATASAGGLPIPLPRSVLVSSGGAFSPPLQPVAGGVMGVGMPTWAPLSDSLPFSTSMQGSTAGGAFDLSSTAATAFSLPPPTDITHLTGADAAGGSAVGQSGGFTVTAPFTSSSAIARFTLDANARPFTPTAIVTTQTTGNSAAHTGFTVNAGVSSLSRPSSVSTSPMAGISGSSPITGAMFPEKPRYTSVSAPVSGGFTGCGPFGIDSLQNTAPLFPPPGSSSGSGTLTLESGKGLSLNFTTAPWN